MEPLAVNRPDITHLNKILNAMGPIIPSSLNEPTLIYCPIPLTFLAWMVACYAYIKSCPIMNISPCHSLPPCVEKSPDKSSHFIASQNSRSTQGGWQEGPPYKFPGIVYAHYRVGEGGLQIFLPPTLTSINI